MSEGHGGAFPALLERRDRAGGAPGQAGHHCRARQQPPCSHQVPGRRQRPENRRTQRAHRQAARLRARRKPQTGAQLLSRRSDRDRGGDACSRRSGQGEALNSSWRALKGVPCPALLRGTGCLLCALLPLVLVPAFAQGEAEKLDALRTRIEGLRAKIAEAEESRTEARDQLRDSERAMSEASRALRALAGRRAAAQRDLDTLLRRGQALETEIASRREGLGRLLTLRYLNGEQSALKLLFSGEEPGRIARELHYYGYVSRALAEFIGELRSSLARLKDLEARTRERNVEIAAIESARRTERAALMKQQGEHRKVLARVSSQLRAQRREVQHLERDESRLSRLVEELGRVIAATPLLRRSEEHTSELQSRGHLVCRLLLEKKNSTPRTHLTGHF